MLANNSLQHLPEMKVVSTDTWKQDNKEKMKI